MLPKYAVARSTPERRVSTKALTVPKPMAAKPSATNQGQYFATSWTTGAVK